MTLERARSGDRDAFGELYARHVRPVYRQPSGVVGSAADTEEATQEVFVGAWRRASATGSPGCGGACVATPTT